MELIPQQPSQKIQVPSSSTKKMAQRMAMNIQVILDALKYDLTDLRLILFKKGFSSFSSSAFVISSLCISIIIKYSLQYNNFKANRLNSQPPEKQFDQLSSASVRSLISNIQFRSPLPLPQNQQKIPSNQEIVAAFAEIQQKFPDIQSDKIFSTLFNNVIAPKIQEASVHSNQIQQEQDEDRLEKQSNYSSLSRSSHVSKASNVSSISSKSSSYKVHPNIHHTYFSNEGKLKELGGQEMEKYRMEKRKKRRKSYRKDPELGRAQRQELRQTLKNMKGETQENLKKAQSWKSQNKEHHLFAKTTAPLFESKQQQINFEEKRLAARAYCQKGFGIDKLKEFVWQTQKRVFKIDKKRYRHVSAAFLNESFRKLEQFLIEDCKRNIKPLTNPEMRALYPILAGAQLKFEDDEYLTFRKFMKVTFDLGSVSIFEQMAVKVYIRVQLCLRGRIGTMKLDRQYKPQDRLKREMLRSPGRFLNQRLQHQSIWTRELQYQLIDTLVEQRTIARTRDKFRQKYGENAILNNVKQLKARFFKILRISIKRLMRYASEYAHKVPLLVPLEDEKVKVMIRHPTALQARFALCRLYKTFSFNQELLADVINKVNQFCYVEESRRDENPGLKEPVISSVTDKIKHNINVSRKLLKNVTTPAQRAGKNKELLFLKSQLDKYQHIVSLEHNDKLHYFRKTGQLNNKGGFEYEEKPPELKRMELEDGDDDSEQMVMVSDEDYDSGEEAPEEEQNHHEDNANEQDVS